MANSARETGTRQGHAQTGRTDVSSLGRVSTLLLLFFFAAGCSKAFAQADPMPLNLPGQIGGRIAKCWKAPETGHLIEVTVRLSFSSSGAVIGEPRITYVRAPAEAGLREKITASILAAIHDCTPLPFTPSFGAAIAGRMLAIRFRSLLGADKRSAI